MNKLFALILSALLLTACSTSPRRDVASIDAKIADVSKGDFGQFLYHQSLAEENLAELRLIRQYWQDDHYWNIHMDADAQRATENALKHKKMAEEALMKWHEPCARHHEVCHRLDEVESWWRHHRGKPMPLAFFDTNSTVPKSLRQEEIDRLLHLAKKHPHLELDLIGYTDGIGTIAYNKHLADRRTLSVEKILVKQGLPSTSKIHRIAFGKAPGADSIEDSKNRRVDIRIHHDHADEMHHGEMRHKH